MIKLFATNALRIYICNQKVANSMRRDIFQAIADPTRRDIIGMIAKNPMTPNNVAESFDVSRQAISKHINILLQCGLLELAHKGRERRYSVHPEKLAEVDKWLKPFRKMWEDRFDALDDLLKEL